ncbi:hypothetical protein K5X82_03680 [Halosquirtibacter xylanolyticus]|uniref:hypothetical protein n=1 Tax=Halosquirtibacter xylanolyticus TaxID=3374599 RepID=UPI003748125D|nr:hypothetical protein K5X82_03680 [Prolixibacteraceae bacterium]
MKNVYLRLSILIFIACCNCDLYAQVRDQFFTCRNEDYYSNGKFDSEKAKDAVITLCKYHGYPIHPNFREKLKVSDYGEGRFAEMGIAVNMVVNNQEDKYMLMEIFLLPGQMLPEHRHLKGDDLPAKLEGWFIRHGMSYIVGVGKDNLDKFPDIKIPYCHNEATTKTKHVYPAYPGDFTKLLKEETLHWQFAGKEGAIMSEVANVHSSPLVRHADLEARIYFLNRAK